MSRPEHSAADPIATSGAPDQEPSTSTPLPFEVWRQDDNGNRFLMSRHPDRAAAEGKVADMESGVQHKQLYYVVEGRA